MRTDVVQMLREELGRRIKSNPRYSMRAFAKSIGLNVGVLSGLLSGQRPVTAKSAEFICDKLGVAPAKKSEAILAAVRGPAVEPNQETKNRAEVDEEIFRMMSDWHHWAILQLVRTQKYLKDPRHSAPRWIARQLQISDIEAKLAIERLISLGLLTKTEKGFLKRTKESLSTANRNVTTTALKKWQRQLREKAIFSLENDPIETRSMTSMTMAIDPTRIAEAKKIIEDFQNKISEFLEADKKDSVYQLCVSLYPLQIREN